MTQFEPAAETTATPGIDRPRRTKLAVVGAGAVGATLAYAALMRGSARTVALHDINRAKVEAEALDLKHGIQFVPEAEVLGSDDIAVCADADVVVVTAGAKQRPGQSRIDLAGATIGLMERLLPPLVDVAPNAIYLMVTNPVDVVTYASLKISGLPPRQLFGSGTVLDSSRLRYLVGEHCGVAVQNVHAYIAGEHGDTEIPLWDSASIGGVRLLDWNRMSSHGPLTEEARTRIAQEVVESAYRIIEGKGATNYAVGLAATRIIEAVINDQHSVLPVSSLLEDFYGIRDVCFSIPSIVGREGVTEQLQIPLSDIEYDGLKKSALAIKDVARSLGY